MSMLSNRDLYKCDNTLVVITDMGFTKVVVIVFPRVVCD